MPGSHPNQNKQQPVSGHAAPTRLRLRSPLRPQKQAATPRQQRAARLGCPCGLAAWPAQTSAVGGSVSPPLRPPLQRPINQPGGRFRVGYYGVWGERCGGGTLHF